MSNTIGFIVTTDRAGKMLASRNVYRGQNLIDEMSAVIATAKVGTFVYAERLVDNEQTETVASSGEISD